jgi:DNA helicase-2/ATP-dependent DNA helicase PcrA
MAEERRLMYVGMTRARRRLYLMYAFQRSQWGNIELNVRSRFIEDIPAHLLNAGGRAKGKTRRQSLRQASAWGGTGSAARGKADGAESGRAAQFKAGQRVLHPRFGEGIVVESRVLGGDEEVSVVFAESGVKRLMASFANMEILQG